MLSISSIKSILSRSRPPEAAVWALITALAIGLRLYVGAHLPTYIWTRDSGSYVSPALDWLETGRWVTNPRRGPLYSLLIAAALQTGGSLLTLIRWQAALGFFTAALTVAAARWQLGRRAFWPVAFCALVYAAYPMPLYFERVVRNETLLTFFSTVSFGAWYGVLRDETSVRERAGWSALSGLAGGFMHALKGIFPVFPVLVLLAIGWQNRRRPALAALLAGCFLLPFVAPTAASRLYDLRSGTARPPEPEDGILFYGRTAQWTVLNGGVEPTLKAQVRPEVENYAERYRRTGKLDNNEIIKRTVVPSLKAILRRERPGFTPSDLNRLCWRLGAEAAWHHPGAYAWQTARDFWHLQFVTAHRFTSFRASEMKNAARDATGFVASQYRAEDPLIARAFDQRAMREVLHRPGAMKGFERWNKTWRVLRIVSPVFLMTLLLPLVCRRARGGARLYWITMTLLWYYYMVLLSTVGRPLDRYLMPVVPLVVWGIATALASWLTPDRE